MRDRDGLLGITDRVGHRGPAITDLPEPDSTGVADHVGDALGHSIRDACCDGGMSRVSARPDPESLHPGDTVLWRRTGNVRVPGRVVRTGD